MAINVKRHKECCSDSSISFQSIRPVSRMHCMHKYNIGYNDSFAFFKKTNIFSSTVALEDVDKTGKKHVTDSDANNDKIVTVNVVLSKTASLDRFTEYLLETLFRPLDFSTVATTNFNFYDLETLLLFSKSFFRHHHNHHFIDVVILTPLDGPGEEDDNCKVHVNPETNTVQSNCEGRKNSFVQWDSN